MIMYFPTQVYALTHMHMSCLHIQSFDHKPLVLKALKTNRDAYIYIAS